jgi:DNA polymerase-3 subunit delta'
MPLKRISVKKTKIAANQSNEEQLINQELYGFQNIEASLEKSWLEKKFYHALLLDGKKGIGKAIFARKLAAKFISLSNKEHTNSAYQFNHPDILLIQKDDGKKEIGVDKIRKIANFINHSGAISESKFIIIDAADELNKSSSNALLKILEEPLANNFLLLISHNLNKILPTIKSRCSLVRIGNLSFEDFKKSLSQKLANKLPGEQELEFLSLISQNSPATAINFISDASDIYQQLLASILDKKIDPKLLKKISEKTPNKDRDTIDQQDILSQIIHFFLKRLLFFLNHQINNFYHDEKEVFERFSKKIKFKQDLDKIFTLNDEIINLLSKSQYLNLDKKLIFTNIFNLICKEIA